LVSGGGGIPRFLPDSLLEHGPASRAAAASPETSNHLRAVLQAAHRERVSEPAYDRRTRENFSREWDHHELGDKTCGIELDERVQRYFLDAVRIPTEELPGLLLLDAGCGNGTQSVAYAAIGLEVIALDFSSSLEHGQRLRITRAAPGDDRVHFVQGDLQSPPLADASVDIIHSAGVLHATPDT
jgi:ubiquinone/menaquinone biosynthesis C-methylase UbiE